MKIVRCEDGVILQGETDGELVDEVRRHIAESHPGLVGRLSDNEILAMAKDIA